MYKYLICLSLILAVTTLSAQESPEAEQKKIIQLTGVIFAPDSNSVIPGVHVYVPLAGRGTTSNPYGFFSMPVLEGDSIVFSSVGFKRASYIVPGHESDNSLKIVVTLQEDITFLNEVEVFPYPSEAMFKEAILSLEMPYQKQYNNLNAWMTADYLSTAYRDLPSSPNANHQYYMQMQMQAIQNRYQPPANHLLNPFAWARFINSLKKE